MLYHFTIDVIYHQVKMSMFFDAQTTNLTFVDKKLRYTIDIYIYI